MAYNEELAYRIRPHLLPFAEHIEEKKMFGGLSFLYKGKMSVGVVKDDLVVRVVSDKFEEALSMPHVQPMEFTGKPMKKFVQVFKKKINYQSGYHLALSMRKHNNKTIF